jgi:hypothetical protein
MSTRHPATDPTRKRTPMSTRRRFQNPQDPRNAVTQCAASLDGARVRGSCEPAPPTKWSTSSTTALTNLRVRHDGWCPELRRVERR